MDALMDCGSAGRNFFARLRHSFRRILGVQPVGPQVLDFPDSAWPLLFFLPAVQSVDRSQQRGDTLRLRRGGHDWVVGQQVSDFQIQLGRLLSRCAAGTEFHADHDALSVRVVHSGNWARQGCASRTVVARPGGLMAIP